MLTDKRVEDDSDSVYDDRNKTAKTSKTSLRPSWESRRSFWEGLGGAWLSGDAGFTTHKFSACVCRLEGAALGRSRGGSEVVFGGDKLKPDTVTANHRAFPSALITRLKVLEMVTAGDKQKKKEIEIRRSAKCC